MILVDTSAWVEYLRATRADAHLRLKALLSRREALATTEVVLMEVLAGARDAQHLQQLRRLLMGCRLLSLHGLADYEDAAALYRSCRSQGKTVRRLTDCLIAIVAIRADMPVLQADRDFEILAQCTPLRLADPTQDSLH